MLHSLLILVSALDLNPSKGSLNIASPIDGKVTLEYKKPLPPWDRNTAMISGYPKPRFTISDEGGYCFLQDERVLYCYSLPSMKLIWFDLVWPVHTSKGATQLKLASGAEGEKPGSGLKPGGYFSMVAADGRKLWLEAIHESQPYVILGRTIGLIRAENIVPIQLWNHKLTSTSSSRDFAIRGALSLGKDSRLVVESVDSAGSHVRMHMIGRNGIRPVGKSQTSLDKKLLHFKSLQLSKNVIQYDRSRGLLLQRWNANQQMEITDLKTNKRIKVGNPTKSKDTMCRLIQGNLFCWESAENSRDTLFRWSGSTWKPLGPYRIVGWSANDRYVVVAKAGSSKSLLVVDMGAAR